MPRRSLPVVLHVIGDGRFTLKRVLLIALGLGVACAHGSYTVRAAAVVPSPVDDVFACLRQQIQVIGYRQRSLDVDAHRVAAQRFNETVRRPDVHFRHLVDVLEFEVQADPSGGTAIRVDSKTFAEYASPQGQTFVQEEASDSVRAAGQAVLAVCSH